MPTPSITRGLLLLPLLLAGCLDSRRVQHAEFWWVPTNLTFYAPESVETAPDASVDSGIHWAEVSVAWLVNARGQRHGRELRVHVATIPFWVNSDVHSQNTYFEQQHWDCDDLHFPWTVWDLSGHVIAQAKIEPGSDEALVKRSPPWWGDVADLDADSVELLLRFHATAREEAGDPPPLTDLFAAEPPQVRVPDLPLLRIAAPGLGRAVGPMIADDGT